MLSHSRTPCERNWWHDKRVTFTAYLRSLIHCPAVAGLLWWGSTARVSLFKPVKMSPNQTYLKF